MKQFLLVLTLFACRAAIAQEQPHYFSPVAGNGQILRGNAGADDGAVGFGASKTDAGFVIVSVTPGGPAEKSGLVVGDAITSIDGREVLNLEETDLLSLLSKKPGETIRVSYTRNGQRAEASVSVERRAEVYPMESTAPPAVTQVLFEGRANVTVALSQAPAQPQSVIVSLYFANANAPLFALDDSKFFVLDGQGQQLRHMSLDEVKYSIQFWLAQNWHGGNYPAPNPPPAQHNYIITATESGDYTFIQSGNVGTMSGTSSSTYTAQEQPDYNQAGYMLGYSIGLAIRKHADRKHNELIAEQAQQTLSQWDAAYFRPQSPLIPGENRSGGVLYWTGSARQAVGPFKVVLFLTDPLNGRQEIAKFEFH